MSLLWRCHADNALITIHENQGHGCTLCQGEVALDIPCAVHFSCGHHTTMFTVIIIKC